MRKHLNHTQPCSLVARLRQGESQRQKAYAAGIQKDMPRYNTHALRANAINAMNQTQTQKRQTNEKENYKKQHKNETNKKTYKKDTKKQTYTKMTTKTKNKKTT